MGNCCTIPSSITRKQKRKEKPGKDGPEEKNNTKKNEKNNLVVLKEPTGREIGLRYELGRELGRGEFGITYLCKDRQTGEELACKSISKNKLRTAIDVEDVRREVEIMRHLPKHPNIVTLKDTYEDDDDVHLVMELCEGGELLDRIVRRGDYTERSAAFVIKTIVKVVQMCHKHGVMHRNLKPENFLFADKKETAPLKVTDFRSSIFFKPGERLNQIVGNLYYMAPEVLNRSYGPEIDIWSAGVILYILLCGFPPFWAETEQGVAQEIIRSVINFDREPWPKVSVSVYAADLVTKMLDPDPNKRLTAQEVLDHPWFNLVKKKPDTSKDLVKKILTTHEMLDRPWLINLLKKKPDKAKGLAKKMLTAHEVLDVIGAVHEIGSAQTTEIGAVHEIFTRSAADRQKNKTFRTVINPRQEKVQICQNFNSQWIHELKKQNHGWVKNENDQYIWVDLFLNESESYMTCGRWLARSFGFQTPTTVNLHYKIVDNHFDMTVIRNLDDHIICISSDSSHNESVENDSVDNESVEIDYVDNVSAANESENNDSDIESSSFDSFENDGVFRWELKVTKAVASIMKMQVAHIPSDIANGMLNDRNIIFMQTPYNNDLIKCKIATSKRSKDWTMKEKYLTDGWYQFVLRYRPKKGDTVRFQLDDPPGVVYAEIIRGD